MIELLILLILAGAALYVVGILPIDGTIRTIVKVVVVIALAVWLLRHLAVLGL